MAKNGAVALESYDHRNGNIRVRARWRFPAGIKPLEDVPDRVELRRLRPCRRQRQRQQRGDREPGRAAVSAAVSAEWLQAKSPFRSNFLLEHDLFGKPVSTFP